MKETGINAYEFTDTHITIQFKTGKTYIYTIDSCGEYHVNKMISLALEGSGLNRYINSNKPDYAFKSP